MIFSRCRKLDRFRKWCRPLRHREQASCLAVILSEAKDLLLYAWIGTFPTEKQIPRCARNDTAAWVTPNDEMEIRLWLTSRWLPRSGKPAGSRCAASTGGKGRKHPLDLIRPAVGTFQALVGVLHPSQFFKVGAAATALVFIDWHILILIQISGI